MEGEYEAYFVDDKVDVFETAITVKPELKDHLVHNQIKQHDISAILDNIKTESDLQHNVVNDKVKGEGGIGGSDIKTEFDSGLLYCEPCHVYYNGYCTKCQMVVHILSRNVLNNIDSKVQEELPNGILKIQESCGQLGIFALNVIPEGVKFGPFTGLCRTEHPWKIKGGKFVVGKDKAMYLNWMQYINPAKNISEQNLFVFQYEDNLYYRSTREIQKGDELLVSFGVEYEDSLNKNIVVDFIPTMEHADKDIFACTFCCLGFSSWIYLAKHKSVCLNKADEKFSNEELMQCPFCKIYMDQKEYNEYHMTCCSQKSFRKYILPTHGNLSEEVSGRKTRQLHLYKCSQCKYRTKYRGDLKDHANQHYRLKVNKCGICNRRFKNIGSLRLHVKKIHLSVGRKNLQAHSISDYINGYIEVVRRSRMRDQMKQFKCRLCELRTTYRSSLKKHLESKHLELYRFKCASCSYRTNVKNIFEAHLITVHHREFDYKSDLRSIEYGCRTCKYRTTHKHLLTEHMKSKHLKKFDYSCDKCDYKTNHKRHLTTHIKSIHLKEYDYQCDACNYGTNKKVYFKFHMKTKHLKEFDYRCSMCDYQTNIKVRFELHMNAKHLKKFNYECEICGYKSLQKWLLENHIKSKHLKEFDYKCETCGYKTNKKATLTLHIKTRHLKEFNYNCEACDYKTNQRSHLKKHINTKHFKEFDCKCDKCEFGTNLQYELEMHIKTKHLKEFAYKCNVCDYKTNFKSSFGQHLKRKDHT